MRVELALSLAGHDKGHYYVILREEGDFVYVADGILKLCEQPSQGSDTIRRQLSEREKADVLCCYI